MMPTTQRDQTKVAIAAIAVAIAGYYYMYPYATRATELETARAHVEALEAQNAKARAQASKGDLATLRAEADRTGASLVEMRRLVPTEHEVPALLEEISTAARRAGLEIGGVAPDPVLKGDEFDTYRYRVTLVGGYHALTTFLANVGSLPRIVAPVAFTLAPAPDNASKPQTGRVASLNASVTLQAYVAHPAPAPKPAEANEAGPDAPAKKSVANTGEILP